MAQKNNTLSLLLALLVTGGILGVGARFLLKQNASVDPQPVAEVTSNTAVSPNNPPTMPTAAPSTPFSAPTTVASGTQIFIDGSTSMVGINVALKAAFESKFPGTRVEFKAQGSSKGIEALIAGQVDVAASSRPLKPEEVAAGLNTVVVKPDQIALVVDKNNGFRQTLTTEQVRAIFTGQTTNWSGVGGPDMPIRVLNRPPVSGTYSAFTELALNGQDVNGPGVTTLERDETTGMLQQLGTDGIGYATYQQIANQSTVRIVPINKAFPEQPEYPYQRQLLYVYKEPASEAVQAFLGFVGAPEAQSAINSQ
ncbi:MAG: phosphate ABC transporter substrate-binding protein [Spirulina sp. SIO3F2]|nr:phosphate ABC transporter substrate-binding protein [Spirulina sp. SIO3F2]